MARRPRGPPLHWAWVVAPVTFLTLVGSAAFRSVPGVLMDPLHMEFGWSHGTIGFAVAVNMALFGLISPFAAALMDRFGIRAVVTVALLMISVGSGLTVFMTAPWQLVLCWGVLVGAGTGSMSMAFVSTVVNRWFVARRGLVSGILTAGNATGQLVFLPVVAWITTHAGWRTAALTTAAAALAVVPLIVFLMRDHPADLGLQAYGATAEDPGPPRHQPVGSSGGRALRVLRDATRTPAFWLLAGGFAICGATTNGLIATHFIPAAMDHGMPPTTAASLLALVGLFDVGGTIASGWFTDRTDPRYLLIAYYSLRGVGTGPVAVPALTPHDAGHVGVHHLLRARLGGDRAADGDAVPRVVRPGGRVDRVRLGLRRPPARRLGDGAGGRGDPRPHRHLRPGVLPRCRAVRDRRGALDEHPPPSAHSRRRAASPADVTPPGSEVPALHLTD